MIKGFGALDYGRPALVTLRHDGGWVESAPFSATPGLYRAPVSLNRKYPQREMECLADVGMPFPLSTEGGRRTDCPPGYSPLQLSWIVLEDGKPSGRSGNFGDHAGEYSDAAVGRSLGSVELRRGRSYKMRVRVIEAPEKLWATNPTVSLAYGDMTGLVVGSLFFSVLSGALGVTGLWLLLAAVRMGELTGRADQRQLTAIAPASTAGAQPHGGGRSLR